MSRERALKFRAIILDNAKKQIAASPQAKALEALMPVAFDHLLQHIASNAAMEIDCNLDEETP